MTDPKILFFKDILKSSFREQKTKGVSKDDQIRLMTMVTKELLDEIYKEKTDAVTCSRCNGKNCFTLIDDGLQTQCNRCGNFMQVDNKL